MRIYRPVIIFLFCALLILFNLPSCKQEREAGGYSFDRAAMLQHYYDQLILPSFEDFAAKTLFLKQAVDSFAVQPNEQNLLKARGAWQAAALSFHGLCCFHFGPAEQLTGSLSENQGTFPVSIIKTEQYITLQDYSMQNFDRDTRGLYGLDYLLFHDSVSALLQQFSSQPGRLNYLKAVAAHTHAEAQSVLDGWLSYRETFTTATGVDAGSSTSLLYNQFLMAYEHAKNIQLALPMGLRVGQLQTEPSRVMGFYSGTSLVLLRAHMYAIHTVYSGRKADGSDGIGFDDYLNKIEGGNALDQQIDNRFQELISGIDQAGTARMDQMITTADPRLNALYTTFQQTIYLVKSEMSSLLGVSITYSSGDGD